MSVLIIHVAISLLHPHCSTTVLLSSFLFVDVAKKPVAVCFSILCRSQYFWLSCLYIYTLFL